MASDYEQQVLDRASDLIADYRAAINSQYAAGIQNLQSQKENAYLEYDPLRASVNNEYAKSVRTNDENMANLGLTRSGTNLTAQLKLDTEKQRGIAGVNAAQKEAERKLQEQINTYIAERDSTIAAKSADIYSSAYNNIAAHNSQLAQMEAQHNYNIEMAKLNQKYERQRQTLDFLYSLAGSTSNNLQQAAFSLGSSVLDQGFNMMSAERQAQLDKDMYAYKSATDWDYYQKQAALDNSYDVAMAQLKNAYSSSSSKSKTKDYSVESLGKNAKALYNLYDARIKEAENTDDPFVSNMNYALVLNEIEHAVDEYQIKQSDADKLINIWGLY
jgi:hypothetical protein